MTDAPKLPTGDSRGVVVIPFLLQCWINKQITNNEIFVCFDSTEIWMCCWKSMHWWLYVTALSVMGHVAAWPLFGPLSWRPVTWSGLWGLIDGRYPLMRPAGARSAVGLCRLGDGGAGWWPWWWLGRHAPFDWNSYCVFICFCFLLSVTPAS